MIDLDYKEFGQLTNLELYAILQLRSEVFVVEQHCVYQDMDGKDINALHILGKKNGQLVAYTRIFGPGEYFGDASIGRVLVKREEREHGYGKTIMEYSVDLIHKIFKSSGIRISAQKYLEKFYSSFGFVTLGKEYLEDGIPHVAMVMKTEKFQKG